MTDACVGCGYCCLKASCMLGQVLFGSDAPCSGLLLSVKENRFYCRAVLEASERDLVKEALAIGAGCCGSLFNTQRDACIKGELQDYLIKIGTLKCLNR